MKHLPGLSFRATYRLEDASDREFLVVKKKLGYFFNRLFLAETPEGAPIGKIQGNFWRTKWDLIDADEHLHATIQFPFSSHRRRFEIETPIGIFKSEKSQFTSKRDVYSPSGEISFTMKSKVHTVRTSFEIQSFGQLSPFITCLAAVLVIGR
jgi:uncharacterized protein YxjI